MTGAEVLEFLDGLGVMLEISGDKLLLIPGSLVPPDVVEELRQHKSEVINILKAQGSIESTNLPRNYRFKYPDAHITDQELSEIESRVLTEGYVLLWSNVLQDLIAFYKHEDDKKRIPSGFVPYSDDELWELFRPAESPRHKQKLRLIHEAKKGGAKVTGTQSEVRTCHACGGTSWWQREDGEYICQCCHPKPKKGL